MYIRRIRIKCIITIAVALRIALKHLRISRSALVCKTSSLTQQT